MRRLWVFVISLVTLTSVPSVPLRCQSHRGDEGSQTAYGLTREELRELAAAIPSLPGRIVAIRFFRDKTGSLPGGVALLVHSTVKGWQVLVLARRENNKYVLGWQSGQLDSSFSVSWEGALGIFNVGGEHVVQFYGCAKHACPDFFSVMIYVPSRNQVFVARHEAGSIRFSLNAEAPENLTYKEWLEQQIRERPTWPMK